MLDTSLINAYCQRHTLTSAAIDYIHEALGGLSRNPTGGNYACVITEYQSSKMGTTVNLESSSAETQYAIQIDWNPKVIGYLEQPPVLECKRVLKNGRTRLTDYHPDFLVLHEDGPFIAQIKTQQALLDLVSSREDWTEDNGTFCDRAADRACEALGIPHRVVSTRSLNPRLGENLLLLRQALDAYPIDEDLALRALKALVATPILSLSELASRCGVIDRSGLLALIARGRLQVDLTLSNLSRGESCMVAADRELLEAWHSHCAEPARAGGRVGIDQLPPERYLRAAIKRLRRLRTGPFSSTTRRWSKIKRDAEARGENVIVALAPKTYRRGHHAKRPPYVLGFCEHFLREEGKVSGTRVSATLFRRYKLAAERWHPAATPVSRPTFDAIAYGLRTLFAYSGAGERGANAQAAPVEVGLRRPRPTRPFQKASCDHYQVDFECIVKEANGCLYTVRPWLTVMRDCYTKRVLAYTLTLSAPSRRNNALVIRACLRRHGRLPEWIVVDRGSDFRSVYFSTFLAHCGVHRAYRPKAHPRFGSEVEQLFKLYTTLWLPSRPGFVPCVRTVRAVSGSHRPEALTCTTFQDFWEDLEAFFAFLDEYTPPSTIASPRALEQQGLALYSCSGRRNIAYDFAFLAASAVDDGRYKIDPARGLHIGELHFWHPALAVTTARYVDVRRDPEDWTTVYALVDGDWVTCHAGRHADLDGLLPRNRLVLNATLTCVELATAVKSDSDRELAVAMQRRREATAAKATEARRDDVLDARSPPSNAVEELFARLRANPPAATDVEDIA